MSNMKRNRIKKRGSDRMLNIIFTAIVAIYSLAVLYPLIFVVSASFSSGQAVNSGRVLLWPVEFSLGGYDLVFANKTVWSGYKNTIIYTVAGTCVNLILTILAAYPLSRKDFSGKGICMTLFMIPMFFGGGLIPTYILMGNLGLVNTRWAIILSGAVSTYNVVVMRTFFMNSIPYELFEAAKIDGITDIGYLGRIVMPLSKAVVAVVTMFYAVGHWNSYFNAMIYLRRQELLPLQNILRSITESVKLDRQNFANAEEYASMAGAVDVMKYALVVVATVPILVAYPFIQKYFEKGVTFGSVKG